MAKKRKASRGSGEPKGPRAFDPADARLGPITSYKDIADSEDEHFMDQDRIMFDDDEQPKSKRQKQLEEDREPLELSDEEILGYDDDDDDDDVDDDDDGQDFQQLQKAAKKARKTARDKGNNEDEDATDFDGGRDDEGWWGSTRAVYYDADNVETEGDALEEEAEAKSLQKKRLAKMTEEDFLFDEAEWAAPAAASEDDGAVVTEVLKEVEVPADMTPEDRYKLLQTRYPEFDHLVNELNTLQPLLQGAQREALGKQGTSVEAVRYWVLGCYVAALASYFAILTSPARDRSGGSETLSPTDLREHEVMETLVNCRKAWLRVRNLRGAGGLRAGAGEWEGVELPAEDCGDGEAGSGAVGEGAAASPKRSAREKEKARKARKAKKNAKAEAAVADLYHLSHRPKKPAATRETKVRDADDVSDFGEEDAIEAHEAAEKAARKKSLRFYTSQIALKANRRATAGRDAGGDADIPYRESFRRREMRDAHKRGTKPRAAAGDDGGEWADDVTSEPAPAKGGPVDSDEEYYDMVASASRRRKEDKTARREALATAGALDRVVEVEDVDEDGKRKITYAIEKNRGLAPRRKKEVRNPRVKYRNKMDKMRKKLVSARGSRKSEPRSGYAGETTGINTSVIRSVRF